MSKVKQVHKEEIEKYGECRINDCEKCLYNQQKEEECQKNNEEARKKIEELKVRKKAEKEMLVKEKSNKSFGKKRN